MGEAKRPMMPPLTDLIERLCSPKHPRYAGCVDVRQLTRDERRELRAFCRAGLAALGLALPPKFDGDDVFVAVFLRAVIRFGAENWSLRALTMLFHPDPAIRKEAAAADGWLWDEAKQQPILDYHGGGAVSGLTRKALSDYGYACGQA